jgi:cell division protein FtsX
VDAVRRHPWRSFAIALAVVVMLALVLFVYGGAQDGGVGVGPA